MITHLEQGENGIGDHDTMRIGRIPQVAFRTEIITGKSSTGHCRAMTTCKEVTDINGRPIQSVLETKRIKHQHCIMEVELGN